MFITLDQKHHFINLQTKKSIGKQNSFRLKESFENCSKLNNSGVILQVSKIHDWYNDGKVNKFTPSNFPCL